MGTIIVGEWKLVLCSELPCKVGYMATDLVRAVKIFQVPLVPVSSGEIKNRVSSLAAQR